jgi:hypothetical protein
MTRSLGFALLLAVTTALRAAEENFTRAVRPEDFSAAGLGKLSADELARLDTLVRDYKSGALAAAKREAETAARAREAAEARAAQAEAKAAAAATAEAARATEKATPSEGASLLSRAKVLLTPGTKVEYATVESRLVGDFKGWGPNTIFVLENGSKWKIQNGDSYYSPAVPAPKVTVSPASLGGFWMKIEGVSSRVRVAPLGGD